MPEEECTCEETAGEEHACPYAEEIEGDSDPMCACCPSCTQECAEGI